MKKMLMIATTAAMLEQFNKNNILILTEMGYEVHVAGNWEKGNPISEDRLENFKFWISENHGKWYHIPATRKPTDLKNNYKAYRIILELIKKNKYEFIHCHTPIGSVITRLASHKMKTKLVYTAHGFHFFQGAPIKNWILYYPVEKFLSKWTDVLITINKEDYYRALSKMYAKQTFYIPGIGVDVDRFSNCLINKEKKLKQLGIGNNKIVLLSVGELAKHKNQKIVIEAMNILKDNELLYLIAGKGNLENYYKKLISKYNLEENIVLLGPRNDIEELCACSDIFIHPSIREGLGIAPLEAMAAGLPLISSYVGGIKDYTEDNVSGICIHNPRSIQEMANAIRRMKQDKILREKSSANNIKIVQNYSIEQSNNIMKKIYCQI